MLDLILLLGPTIQQTKTKKNNMFMKKLVSMKTGLSIYNIICLLVYMY